jgi:fibronectin-binding autotransporter adhesin
MSAIQKSIGEVEIMSDRVTRKSGNLRLRQQRRLILGAAVCSALLPCSFAAAQLSGTTTITTANGVSGGTISQPDFSNTDVVGYEDYSNNDYSTSGYRGGPGQIFYPTTGFTLDSVTVKGAGSAGANSPATLAGNWTITIGTVTGGTPGYGAGLTILDQETAVGTPIANDVTNGITTNYDMFTLQNQIALTADTYYFFAITSNNSSNNANAWYAFSKGSNADPQTGVSAIGLVNGPTPNEQYIQGVDFTYFLNASLVVVSNNNGEWGLNGNGNWTTAADWVGSAPPANSQSNATFDTDGGTITSTPTVTLTSGEQVNSLTFNSSHGYVLAGSTVSVTSEVNSLTGTNTIASLSMNTATVSVSAGSVLNITSLTHSQYNGSTFTGGGTVNIGTITDPQGNVDASGGTTVNITGTIPSGAFFYDINLATAADTVNLGSGNTYDDNSIDGPGTIILGSGTTLTTDEYNGFTYNGSLSGTGSLNLGSDAAYTANLVGYVGEFLGTSPNFSGAIDAAWTSTLEVGAGASLGNGSASNSITLDSGALFAIGTTSLPQNITIEDTAGLVNGITTVDVSSGNTLTLTGQISGTNTLQKTDAGVLVLSGSNSYSGGTDVTAGTVVVTAGAALPANENVSITGGLLQLAPGATGAKISGLTIGSGGLLDITNNHMYIVYGSGADSITTIYGYLKSGFNNGAWNGTTGIISSTAQTATNGLHYGIGWADGDDGVHNVSNTLLSSGEILLKYTLLGDANLDGTVNGTDFSILASNFGLGVTNWDQGNFLYGSSVNGSDFIALAANFGQGDSGADVAVTPADIAALDAFAAANGLPAPIIGAVPEPATMSIVLGSSIAALARRRRGTKV